MNRYAKMTMNREKRPSVLKQLNKLKEQVASIPRKVKEHTKQNEQSQCAAISEKALSLCEIKNQDDFLSLFLLGILCNIFIFIGVDEYKKNEHVLGKYLAIILAVMGFILVGSEHCVADMFYYNMAGIYSPDMFIRLLIITDGNTVGGILANYFVKRV